MGVIETVDAVLTAPRWRHQDPALFPVTVAAAEHVAPAMRRLTLTAPELQAFRLTGPDEYFGLFVPRPGVPLELPAAGTPTRRAAKHVQGELRWYSIRAHRPAVAEVDVDVFLGDHDGPGEAWVKAAAPGDVAGFGGGGSGWTEPEPGTPALVIGDESAVPAIAAILEARTAGEPTRVVVEAVDAQVAALLGDGVTVLARAGRPGDALVAHVAGAPPAAGTYAWVCGEGGLVARTRRALLDAGLSRRRVVFSGYWSEGRAR